jgi:hypothetical protein
MTPKIVIPRWRASDAHKNNCCAGKHGCKWSEKDCPVVLGTVKPGPCRRCLNMDYPTADAYKAAVTALWKHREAEERLAAANKVLCSKNKTLRNQIRLLKKRAAAARRIQTKHF